MKTLLITGLYALNSQIVDAEMEIQPKFFLAIIGGVILAIVFQLIFTALSVAIGISSIGDLKQKFASRYSSKVEEEEDDYEFDQDYSGDAGLAYKISTGFGIWSAITTSIALFLATYLAIKLSLVTTTETSITMALVIWGAFYLIMFYLESRIVNSTIGSLISTATAGLKYSVQGIKNLTKPSKRNEIESVVDHSIDKIKQELEVTIDESKINSVVSNFLNKIDNKIPDYETLKSDLETIAKKSKSKNTAGKWMAIQQVLTSAINKNESSSNADKSKTEKLKQLLNKVKSSYSSDNSLLENAASISSEFTDKDQSEIENLLRSFEERLKTISAENFDNINNDVTIKDLIKNPRLSYALAQEMIPNLSRQNLINILDQNTSLDKSKLEYYADKVDAFVADQKLQWNKDNDNSYIRNFESTIASYLDSTNREELAYSELKRDVKRIFDNPQDSYNIVKGRVSSFDKETLKALLLTIPGLEQKHIDAIQQQFNTAHTETKGKLKQIKQKAKQQYEMSKRKAVIKAEQIRLTAASAAWWLVITAIVSGAASVGGALLY